MPRFCCLHASGRQTSSPSVTSTRALVRSLPRLSWSRRRRLYANLLAYWPRHLSWGQWLNAAASGRLASGHQSISLIALFNTIRPHGFFAARAVLPAQTLPLARFIHIVVRADLRFLPLGLCSHGHSGYNRHPADGTNHDEYPRPIRPHCFLHYWYWSNSIGATRATTRACRTRRRRRCSRLPRSWCRMRRWR